MADAFAQLWINLGMKSTVSKDISGVTSDLEKLDKSATKTQKNFESVGKGMTSAGVGMTAGVTVPLVAIGAALTKSASDASQWEDSMSLVYTELPNSSAEMRSKLEADAFGISETYGILPENVSGAIYDAIGAGIQPDGIVNFFDISAKAAKAGATDIQTSGDAITTAMNAYKSQNLSAAEAADDMFAAMSLGKITFPQLAAAMSGVTNVASAYGVTFKDLTAAYGAMTAKGIPAAEATTQLARVIAELGDTGSKAGKVFKETAGVTFQEYIAQGHSMADAIGLMDQAAQKNGVSTDQMFGSVEAGQAVLALGGENLETYRTAINATANSHGALDKAYSEFSENTSLAMDQLAATFSVASIEIGESIIPVIADTLIPLMRDDLVPFIKNDVVPGVKAIASIFNSLPGPVKTGILVFVALLAALGPILVVAGAVASGIGAIGALFATGGLLAGAAGVVGTVGAAILTLINPITLAIAAAILLYEVITHWDELSEIAGEVFGSISEFVSETVDNIVEYFTSIDYEELGKDAMNLILDGIERVGPILLRIVYSIFLGIPTKILSIDWFSLGVTVLTSLKNGMVSILSGLGSIVLGALSAIAERLEKTSWGQAGIAIWNSFLDGIKSVLSGPYETITEALELIAAFLEDVNLRSIGSTIWNTFLTGILDVVQGPYNAINGAITSIIAYLGAINLSSIGSLIWNTFLAGLSLVIFGPYDLIVRAIDTIRTFLSGTNYSEQGSIIWNTFLAGLNLVIFGPYNAIVGTINNIITFLSNVNLSSIGSSLWNIFLAGINAVILGPYNAIAGTITAIITYLSGINLSSVGSAMIDTLTNGVTSALWNLITTASSYMGSLTSILSSASSAISTLQGYYDSAKSLYKSISSFAGGSSSKSSSSSSNNPAYDTWSSQGGEYYNGISFAASGGIVDQATLLVAGEAGTEAIIPVDRFADIINLKGLVSGILGSQAPSNYKSSTGGTTNGGDTYNINIGTVNKQTDIDYLMKEIDKRNSAKRVQRGIF